MVYLNHILLIVVLGVTMGSQDSLNENEQIRKSLKSVDKFEIWKKWLSSLHWEIIIWSRHQKPVSRFQNNFTPHPVPRLFEGSLCHISQIRMYYKEYWDTELWFWRDLLPFLLPQNSTFLSREFCKL